jgi:hypothetical protein
MSRRDIKPYSKKELANLYEVSTRCFSTMLLPFNESIGKKSGRYFNVKQVEGIFKHLGYPNSLLVDELVTK